MLRPPTNSHSRGFAMIAVMCVVALATVMAWAMLSSASLRNQTMTNAHQNLDANYLAESGASLALYYIRYPEKSPVTLQSGAFGAFYPGQNGLVLWAGAPAPVNISVSNPTQGIFRIISACTVGGETTTVTAWAKAGYAPFTVTSGLISNGDYVNPSLIWVTGGTVAYGTLGGSTANLSGGRFATNGSSVGGTNREVSTGRPAPEYSELTLVHELSVPIPASTRRKYTHNGMTYQAQKVPSTTITSASAMVPAANNPGNVWWTDQQVLFNNFDFAGTIVTVGASPISVQFGGTSRLRPRAGFPALIVSDDLDLISNTTWFSSLTVEGLVFIGDDIKNSGNGRTDGILSVTGAMIFGGSSSAIQTAGATPFKTPGYIGYNASKVAIPNLAPGNVINSMSITAWEKR